MIRITALVLVAALGVVAQAKQFKITPFGNLKAPTGGTLNRVLQKEPPTINPVNAADAYAAIYLFPYVLDGLLQNNPTTYELEPALAEKYEVSKDSLSITYHLRKDAKFSDGSPVTSEDVKFTMEYPKNPAYTAASKLPYVEDIDKVETPDPLTVVIKLKKRYYADLQQFSNMPILSKKFYGDPKKDFGDNPLMGSGPYKVESYNRGKNVMLVRNPLWWGASVPEMKGVAKFDHVNFKFVSDENLTLQIVKRGDIDYDTDVRAESFFKLANGEPFGTKVGKYQVENKMPKSLSFVGWNEKSPIFRDRDVRLAMSELFNRKELIQKFYYGSWTEARGPFSYNNPQMDPSVKAVPYDPEAAKALLKKAGWEDKDKIGILQKQIDGKKVEFRFDLILPNREVEKYFTLYKEDLRKAGIEMNLRLVEWSTFTKLLDEKKFDAITLRWTGGEVEEDPKQIWHSDSAANGGSNFISYSNKEVDKLIDLARQELNRDKRMKLWRKVGKLIADDHPYTFMFNPKYELYYLNKRVASDKATYPYSLPYPYFYPTVP